MFFEEKDNIKNQTQDMVGLANSINLANLGLKKFSENLKSSLNPEAAIKMKLALEELTTTMVRETMGQTKVISEGLEKTIARATFETSLFGITAEDNLRLVSEINNEMQTTTLLTSEQVTNIQLLSRSMGVASKESATMVRAFADIGVGTDQAIENINTMSKQARAYGINVSQFMGKISENIKRLSSYNFKDGIEGFTRMIAKAQSLRIDVSKTFSLAEGLMDPEKAIEMAAGFQMVGGAVGSLGDPFKLLHMAQSDVAGLQDELLKASESAVSFNEETGEFDIAVTEMYRLREIAKLTNKSYEEVADEAIKTKQKTEKLRLLENSLGGFTDEQKELITNFGQIVQDGRGGVDLKLQIPGMDELVNAEDLTPEQISKLEELQRENGKTEIDISKEIRDINKEQLSVLKAREGLDNQIQTITPLVSTETPAIGDLMDVFRETSTAASEGTRESFSPDVTIDLGQKLSEALENGFNSPEANMALQNAVNNLTSTITTEFKDIPNDIKRGLADTDNVFKDSNPLQRVTDVLKKFTGDVVGLDIGNMESQFETINEALDSLLNREYEHLNQRTEQRTGRRNQDTSENGLYNPEDFVEQNQNNMNGIDVSQTVTMDAPEVKENIKEETVVNEVNNVVRETSEGKMVIDGSITLNIPNMTNPQMQNILPDLIKNPEFIAAIKQIAEGKSNVYG